MQKATILLSIAILFFVQIHAQGRLLNQPVQLKSCHISIKANAFVATTVLELEFYNSRNVEVEGQQYFQLNRGQVVTGFQLELDGKFRDGSIEERGKANRAYGSIVGKRIDPAILQMTGQDHYTLHIYPIAANSSRKVRIIILQMMKEEKENLVYQLPLQFEGNTSLFSLAIDVRNAGLQMTCNRGLLEDKFFSGGGDRANLQFHAKDLTLNKAISFSILLEKNKPVICFTKVNNRDKFFIRFNPSLERYYPTKPKSLIVFWDASRSSGSRNIRSELNFLEKYIMSNGIIDTKIILFNQQLISAIEYRRGRDRFSTIKNYLANYIYDGATQLGNLDFSLAGADVILLFSDGINTFGNSIPRQGTVPVTCIVSGKDYNSQHLQNIVSTTGGKVIYIGKDLNVKPGNNIDSAENYLMQYSSPRNFIELHQRFPIKLGHSILLSGNLKKADTLKLLFGNNNAVNAMQKFYLSAMVPECDPELAGQISLLNSYDSIMYKGYDWYKRLLFGLKNRVVTTQTSFLVLERIEDYIKYNIAPPKELEKQCADMNYVYHSEYRLKALKANSEEDGLAAVIADYNRKIVWWDRSQPLIDLTKPVFAAQNRENSFSSTSGNAGFASQSMTDANESRGSNQLSEVVVTAHGQLRSQKSLGYSSVRISKEEINLGGRLNIQHALMGKVSGLTVITNNNDVFADTKITLRGIRSLRGNNQPMLIIDGFPTELSQISTLNPNNIRDVTVLKSTSATAIYGADAVNGAILVSTKKGRFNYNYPVWKEYKLNSIEDVEYLQEIRDTDNDRAWEFFKELEKLYSEEPGFYFDMATHFFERGKEQQAMDILYNAAELCNGSSQGMKAVGYLLESWKNFTAAISIYKNIIAADANDMITKRDLALAYYQKGEYQQCVETYYDIINHDRGEEYNYDQDEIIKATAMDEMNAVIAIHGAGLNLSKINGHLIRPLPVDLRISIESNKSISNFQVMEPGGEVCNKINQFSKNGGYYSVGKYAGYYSRTGYDYSIRDASKGKYTIKVDAYEYGYKKQIPHFVRVLIFKNFQTNDQSLEIKNIILDNQYGEVIIHETSW